MALVPLRPVGRRCAMRRSRAARGKASACCFYNAALDARCVVHGDDFTFTGYDADLDVVEKLMDA
eukprot:7893496-Alexandrium_andersonii.AAC.1